MGSMLKLQSSAELTMTSREIADLVESRHDSVKRTIARLVKAAAIGDPPLVEYRDDLGRAAVEYQIIKRDSFVIVAQLSPAFTARLVDRWQELEAAALKAPDMSDPHALRALLLGYTERVIELDAKIAADAPKVAFAEAVRSMDGTCHIGKVAKALGFGQNRLFKRLRADGILLDNNLPYQKYIDREYFSVIEQQPYTDSKGVTHATFTTMVTGAGQVFLAKRYANIAGGANA
jgi:anti-repressor protein